MTDTTAPVLAGCLCCDRPLLVPGRLACPPCIDRLGRTLDELRGAWTRLHQADLAASGGGSTARRAPGFGSRSPIRLAVLALIHTPVHNQRPDPDNLRNAPILHVAAHWADLAREDQLLPDLAGDRTVTGELLRLRGVVDELAGRWWVGDLARSLGGTLHRAHLALGEVEPEIPFGDCPRPTPDGLAEHRQLVADLGERLVVAARDQLASLYCGGQVRGNREHARCRRCGASWAGEAAVHRLGAQLGDAMLDLAGLARYLGIDSIPRLRQWAHRDGWTRTKVGGRTLYSLAEARASAWRRFERQAGRIAA